MRELVNHVSQSRIAAETRLRHYERLEATATRDSANIELFRQEVASLRASIKEMDEAIQGVFYSNPTLSRPEESGKHLASHRPKV